MGVAKMISEALYYVWCSKKMKQDRFLLIILTSIGLLMIAAIAVFFIRKNSQAYGSEDTPEGVLRNYVLAINQEDYAKAYRYLQDSATKPDFEKFQQQMSNKSSIINRTAFKIISVEISDDQAEIKVILTREGYDLFDTRHSSNRTVDLLLEDGTWKLISVPYPFGY